jgi:hypothetical protein
LPNFPLLMCVSVYGTLYNIEVHGLGTRGFPTHQPQSLTVNITSTSGYCFVINVEMKAYFAEHCSTLYIIIHYLCIK